LGIFAEAYQENKIWTHIKHYICHVNA
jgi:hypothetical protein